MKVKIHCDVCGSFYSCFNDNTKIYGSIIETTCPSCKKFTKRNFSAFLDKQTENIEDIFKKAIKMIHLAQAMSHIINDENVFSIRKKHDISNL